MTNETKRRIPRKGEGRYTTFSMLSEDWKRLKMISALTGEPMTLIVKEMILSYEKKIGNT
jgi:predicted DNA-binding protein